MKLDKLHAAVVITSALLCDNQRSDALQQWKSISRTLTSANSLLRDSV